MCGFLQAMASPLLPVLPFLFDLKVVALVLLKLSVVVSSLVSLMVDKASSLHIVVVFLSLFLVETQGLTRSTLPMKKTPRLAGIASFIGHP